MYFQCSDTRNVRIIYIIFLIAFLPFFKKKLQNMYKVCKNFNVETPRKRIVQEYPTIVHNNIVIRHVPKNIHRLHNTNIPSHHSPSTDQEVLTNCIKRRGGNKHPSNPTRTPLITNHPLIKLINRPPKLCQHTLVSLLLPMHHFPRTRFCRSRMIYPLMVSLRQLCNFWPVVIAVGIYRKSAEICSWRRICLRGIGNRGRRNRYASNAFCWPIIAVWPYRAGHRAACRRNRSSIRMRSRCRSSGCDSCR